MAASYKPATFPPALTVTFTQNDVKCYGDNSGSIDISVSGGTSYTYIWTASAGGIVPAGQANNQDLTGLVAGYYRVKVYDNGVLDGTTLIVITQPEVLSATVASTNVTCNGANNGTITISNPLGGNGNYEFSIDAGANWQASESFTSLASATYNVQIRDADYPACVIVLNANLIINQPNILSAT
ncbi:MAG TPA: SprB repeat-containing protein, partial [Bacteroidales bacterium]